MNNYFWVNSDHIFVCPREIAVIFLKELDESCAKFFIQMCPNLDFVVRMVWINDDFVDALHPAIMPFCPDFPSLAVITIKFVSLILASSSFHSSVSILFASLFISFTPHLVGNSKT